MLAFLGTLFLLALVNAQKPEPCETPSEWTARQMTFDPSKNFSLFARVSYDAFGERLSIVEEVDVDKERKFYEYIFLHREHTMYEIELSSNKTGKCVKKELTEPFHRIEIPENATFLAEGTIGSNALPGLGVNVALFEGQRGDDHYFVTVTEPGCVPVHENVISKKYGLIHTSFFDVELGVDPERFVPPRECEETVIEEDETDIEGL